MKQFLAGFAAVLLFATTVKAQSLQQFTVVMDNNNIFLSIGQKKAVSSNEAVAVKNSLNLALVQSKEDNKDVLEWYNMDKNHEKVPQELTGEKTGIAAISFDRDQFDQCKTAADLKRMTGHISKNSLSHFAVIRNGSGAMQHCFIAETPDGKRALLYVTAKNNDQLQVEVKSE